MKSVATVVVTLALVSGCAAPDPKEIKPIQSVYAERLAQLKIGASLSDFRKAFPEAYPAGQSGGTTAYELTLKQVVRDKRRPVDTAMGFYQPQNLVSDQALWFYFYSDRLVQWGRPQDWPQHPDTIIEQRRR